MPGLSERASGEHAVTGAAHVFSFHGATYCARFADPGDGPAALAHEAALLEGIGAHPNVHSFVGQKELDGVPAIVFDHRGCVKLAEILRSPGVDGSRLDALSVHERADLLNALARGLLAGVSAVHETGRTGVELDPEKLWFCADDLQLKLSDFSGAIRMTPGDRLNDTSDNQGVARCLRAWLEALRPDTAGGTAEFRDWPSLIAALDHSDPAQRMSPLAVLSRHRLFATPLAQGAVDRVREALFARDVKPVISEAPSRALALPSFGATGRADAAAPLALTEHGKAEALPAVQQLTASGVSVLKSFANRMLLRLIGDLVARYNGVPDLFRDLNTAIRDPMATPAQRIVRVVAALGTHRATLPAPLRAYTDRLVDCMRPIERLLAANESGHGFGDLDRIRRIVTALESVLSEFQGDAPGAVGHARGTGAMASAAAGVHCVGDGLALLDGLRTLGEDASFGACLDVLLSSPGLDRLILPELLAPLHQLDSILRTTDRLSAPLRARLGVDDPGAPVAERLASLMQVFLDPAALAELEPHLPADWRSSPVFAVITRLMDFPVHDSPSVQMRWLADSVQRTEGASALKSYAQGMVSGLVGQQQAQALLRTLLTVADPTASYVAKSTAIASYVGSNLSYRSMLALAKPVASSIPFAGPLISLMESGVDLYQDMPAGATWREAATHFSGVALGHLRKSPEWLAWAMPFSGASTAVHAAEAYLTAPSGMSLSQTTRWAASKAAQHPEIKGYYDYYILVSLLYQLASALRSASTLQAQERALGEIGALLKGYFASNGQSHLASIADLLVFFPALLKVAPQCAASCRKGSMDECVEGMLEVIGQTDSPALRKLAAALQLQLENCLSDGLMAGFDAVSGVAGSALGFVASKASDALAALASMPDPLSLDFMLAEGATEAPLPESVRRQEAELKRLTEEFEAEYASATAPSATGTDSTQDTPEDEAIGTGDLSHIADDFHPFHDKPRTRSAGEIAAYTGLSVMWCGTALLLHQNLRQWHAEAAQRRLREAPSEHESIEMRELATLVDPITGLPGSTTVDVPAAADVPTTSAMKRYGLPIGLGGAIVLSAGATWVVTKTYLDKPEEAEATEELEEASPIAAAQTGAGTTRRPTPWEASMMAKFDFSAYSRPDARWLSQNFQLEISTLRPTATTDARRTDQCLASLDSRLGAEIGTGNYRSPISRTMISQFAAISVERANVRRWMAERRGATPGLSRTASLALPAIGKNAKDLALAYDLQPIDARLYNDELLRYYQWMTTVSARTNAGAVGANSRNSATTTATPLRPVYSRAEARTREIYRIAIGSIDALMCNYMIRIFEQGNCTWARAYEQLAARYKKFRENTGDALMDLYAPSQTQAAEKFVNYTRAEQIKLEQAVKSHGAWVYSALADVMACLSYPDHKMLTKRMGPQAAVAQAKIHATRITLDRFAMGDDPADNHHEALSEKEALRLHGHLKLQREAVSSFLYRTEAFLFAIFTGDAPDSMTAVQRRKFDGLDGNARATESQRSDYLADPDRYFAFRGPMLKKFSDAERAYSHPDRLGPPPPGYSGMLEFKRSNAQPNWSAYFRQFNNYDDKSLKTDAGRASLLALIDAGLGDELSLAQPVRSTRLLEVVCLSRWEQGFDPTSEAVTVSPIVGKVGVIHLVSDEVLVLTMLNGRARSRLFTKAEAGNNRVLRRIVNDQPMGRAVFAPGVKGGYTADDMQGAELTASLIDPIWGSVAQSPMADKGIPALIKRDDGWSGDEVPYKLNTKDKTLLDMSDEVMRHSYKQLSSLLKAQYIDSTFWHSALNFVPFGSIAFDEVYNRDYKVDKGELVMNLVALAAAMLPMGIELAELGEGATEMVTGHLTSGMQAGTVGRELIRSTLEGVIADPACMRLGLEALKTVGIAAYNTLFPVPFNIMRKPFTLRAGVNSTGVRPAAADAGMAPPLLTSGTIRYRIRTEDLESPRDFVTNPVAVHRPPYVPFVATGLVKTRDVWNEAITYAWWNDRMDERHRHIFTVQNGRNPEVRSAARHLMYNAPATMPPARDDCTFTVELLTRLGDLPDAPRPVAGSLSTPEINIGMMSSNVRDFMADPVPLRSQERLLAVPPGALVAFVDRDGRSCHVMVSIGGGWLASSRNDHLRPSLSPRRSIITAEELGPFVDDKIMDGRWSLMTGFSKETTVHRQTVPATTVRQKELFGHDVGSIAIHEGGVVTLKSHGGEFTVNDMDAPETCSAVLGQVAMSEHPGPVTLLRLISCEGAKSRLGINICTAQVMADRLNATVMAYEGEVSMLTAHLPADVGPAGAKTFRSRLAAFDDQHLGANADPVARAKLVLLIAKDAHDHVFWHNASAKLHKIISTIRATIRGRPERAAPPRTTKELEQLVEKQQLLLLQNIASYVLGEITGAELRVLHPLTPTEVVRFGLMSLEGKTGSYSDDDYHSACMLLVKNMTSWRIALGAPT